MDSLFVFSSAFLTIRSTDNPLVGFQSNFNASSSRHYITSIDVNEAIAPSTTLRCTLIVFTDKLVLVKRSRERPFRALLGLDDIDSIVQLYHQVRSAEFYGVSITSSKIPNYKRFKKGYLGKFRGSFDILALHTVDFGGNEFGLVLERPPVELDLGSERWLGRPGRKYVVASECYAVDVKRGEKETFMRILDETKCLWKAVGVGGRCNERLAKRGRLARDDRGNEGDVVRNYWSLWDRQVWQRNELGKRVRCFLWLPCFSHARGGTN